MRINHDRMNAALEVADNMRDLRNQVVSRALNMINEDSVKRLEAKRAQIRADREQKEQKDSEEMFTNIKFHNQWECWSFDITRVINQYHEGKKDRFIALPLEAVK